MAELGEAQAEGFGARVFGRLFASIYRHNMEKAISRLTDEMNASSASQRLELTGG